tara:strand:+ start:333 stop:590 length:258 start_codon:yes stop_codon:yes gene_type:complete
MPLVTATLTAANPSVNLSNSAGSIEIAGVFGGATVTQNLTGGSVAVDTFTTAETLFTNANRLTFSATSTTGTTAVTIRWYNDSKN